MTSSLASDSPDVAVVLAAYNEEKYLPYLLESLRGQETSLGVEVIVLDDRSTDRTAEVARDYGARVVPNERGLDIVGMRNHGVRLSRARAILITDADCAYSEDFIQRMAAPIFRRDIDVEATLCLWQAPLEQRYDVVPGGRYSKSYRLYVRRAPALLSGKRWPMRVVPWLGSWARSGFQRPLMSIGDRVRTGMIMVSRDLFERVGGQRGRFGDHEDTIYSVDCLLHARQTRWVSGVVHYYSVRRDYPAPGLGWIARPLRRPVTDPTADYLMKGRR